METPPLVLFCRLISGRGMSMLGRDEFWWEWEVWSRSRGAATAETEVAPAAVLATLSLALRAEREERFELLRWRRAEVGIMLGAL